MITNLELNQDIDPRNFTLLLLQRLGTLGIDMLESAIRAHGTAGITGDAFIDTVLRCLSLSVGFPGSLSFPWQRKCACDKNTVLYEPEELIGGFLPSVVTSHGGINFVDVSKGYEFHSSRGKFVEKRQKEMGQFISAHASISQKSLGRISEMGCFESAAATRYALAVLFQAIDKAHSDRAPWEEIAAFFAEITSQGKLALGDQIIGKYYPAFRREVELCLPSCGYRIEGNFATRQDQTDGRKMVAAVCAYDKHRITVAFDTKEIYDIDGNSLESRSKYKYEEGFGNVVKMARIQRSSGQHFLVVSSSDCWMRMFDESTKQVAYSRLFGSPQTSLKYIPDLKLLLSGAKSGIMSYCAVKEHTQWSTELFSSLYQSTVTDFAYLSKPVHIAAGLEDGVVQIYDGDTRAALYSFLHKNTVDCLDYCPHFDIIAVGGRDANPVLWVPGDSRCIPTVLCDSLLTHKHPIVNVHFVEGTPQFFSTDAGGVIKLWDLRMMECIQTLQHKTKTLRHIEFFDKVKRFLVFDNNCVEKYSHHDGTIDHVPACQDVSASGSACVEPQSKLKVQKILSVPLGVRSIQRRQSTTASRLNLVGRIRDEERECLRQKLNAEEETLIVGCSSNCVRIWRAKSGALLMALPLHQSENEEEGVVSDLLKNSYVGTNSKFSAISSLDAAFVPSAAVNNCVKRSHRRDKLRSVITQVRKKSVEKKTVLVLTTSASITPICHFPVEVPHVETPREVLAVSLKSLLPDENDSIFGFLRVALGMADGYVCQFALSVAWDKELSSTISIKLRAEPSTLQCSSLFALDHDVPERAKAQLAQTLVINKVTISAIVEPQASKNPFLHSHREEQEEQLKKGARKSSMMIRKQQAASQYSVGVGWMLVCGKKVLLLSSCGRHLKVLDEEPAFTGQLWFPDSEQESLTMYAFAGMENNINVFYTLDADTGNIVRRERIRHMPDTSLCHNSIFLNEHLAVVTSDTIGGLQLCSHPDSLDHHVTCVTRFSTYHSQKEKFTPTCVDCAFYTRRQLLYVASSTTIAVYDFAVFFQRCFPDNWWRDHRRSVEMQCDLHVDSSAINLDPKAMEERLKLLPPPPKVVHFFEVDGCDCICGLCVVSSKNCLVVASSDGSLFVLSLWGETLCKIGPLEANLTFGEIGVIEEDIPPPWAPLSDGNMMEIYRARGSDEGLDQEEQDETESKTSTEDEHEERNSWTSKSPGLSVRWTGRHRSSSPAASESPLEGSIRRRGSIYRMSRRNSFTESDKTQTDGVDSAATRKRRGNHPSHFVHRDGSTHRIRSTATKVQDYDIEVVVEALLHPDVKGAPVGTEEQILEALARKHEKQHRVKKALEKRKKATEIHKRLLQAEQCNIDSLFEEFVELEPSVRDKLQLCDVSISAENQSQQKQLKGGYRRHLSQLLESFLKINSQSLRRTTERHLGFERRIIQAMSAGRSLSPEEAAQEAKQNTDEENEMLALREIIWTSVVAKPAGTFRERSPGRSRAQTPSVVDATPSLQDGCHRQVSAASTPLFGGHSAPPTPDLPNSTIATATDRQRGRQTSVEQEKDPQPTLRDLTSTALTNVANEAVTEDFYFRERHLHETPPLSRRVYHQRKSEQYFSATDRWNVVRLHQQKLNEEIQSLCPKAEQQLWQTRPNSALTNLSPAPSGGLGQGLPDSISSKKNVRQILLEESTLRSRKDRHRLLSKASK